MLFDLLIRGGLVVTPFGVQRSDLAVADGTIVALEAELGGQARETIDATSLHVFPGVIDPHVHCNEPGRTEWEGFVTATRALAAGGCTTFFDMPLNAHPPTCDAASFDVKLACAQAASIVDFALWGGLVPGNLADLAALAERGVIGLKAFMSTSGSDDFQAADDTTLWEGMCAAARLGLTVAVHAENDRITADLARRAIAAGRTSIRDYLDSRPLVAELEAITRAITFAEASGCALHIVHVSSGAGVALVAEAQARGVDVTCETCPHYLVLTSDDVERLGAVAKCAPPLRARHDQDALWRHIGAGTLAMVTSDHSPAPAAMKQGENFFAIWGGISGCQSTLPLMLTAGAHERAIALDVIARCTASTAAERFRLPNKGRLVAGADADLVLVDLDSRAVLAEQDLLYRHKHSPYLGMELAGQVRRTIVRGRTVMRDGQVSGTPHGRLVRPAPRTTA